jgi:hypothetical protein
MSFSDSSKALLMQHFLKDLKIMLSGMAFHAAHTHRATSEGAAHLIFSSLLNHGQDPQSRSDYWLNLSLKSFLMYTSIGCNTDVIPLGIATSSVFILRS